MIILQTTQTRSIWKKTETILSEIRLNKLVRREILLRPSIDFTKLIQKLPIPKSKEILKAHPPISDKAFSPTQLIILTINILFFLFIVSGLTHSKCVGRFVNPISDICWKCLFPLKIAGIKVVNGNPSPSTSNTPLCFCKRPPLPVPVPGIPVSFWEPVRLVDVTRTPYCLVNMGGLQIANTGVRGRGDVAENTEDGTHHSFYHVHWYVYPIAYWLEILTDFACLETLSIDLAYLTELDPLWNDDEKSFILNPEAALFSNPLAQASCAADCVAATTHLPRKELFWCMGCQGSLYPFTGTINDHTGGVQASLLVTGKFIAKLHRELLLWGTYGKEGLCGKYPMPIIKGSVI